MSGSICLLTDPGMVYLFRTMRNLKLTPTRWIIPVSVQAVAPFLVFIGIFFIRK